MPYSPLLVSIFELIRNSPAGEPPALPDELPPDGKSLRFVSGGWDGRAWQIAPAVGLDLWDEAFAQLQTNTFDAWLYQTLTSVADLGRVYRVLAFAEEALPLEAIASGPRDQLPGGREFQPHHCLALIVQEMQRPDVYNDRLIATALRSPIVSDRNMGIRALQRHSPDEWGDWVRRALRQTWVDEPREDVRERLKPLLAAFG